MKLIHTADWHLGQTFHGQERHIEHQAFLAWLLDTLDSRRPDALLIAGDVFDNREVLLRLRLFKLVYLVVAARLAPRALAGWWKRRRQARATFAGDTLQGGNP